MDYSDVTVSAHVDWIEVKFTLACQTQGRHIRDRARAILKDRGQRAHLSFVRSATEDSTSDTFIAYIQDPTETDIRDVLAAISSPTGWTIDGRPSIHAIEVAIDFRRRGADRASLATLLVEVLGSLAKVASSNHRLYRRTQETRDIPTHPERFRALLAEEDTRHVGIGNKDDDYYQHAYVKTSDTAYGDDGSANHKVLPKDQWRARLELRLRGEGLPADLRTIDNLKRFRFTKLSDWFGLRVLGANSPLYGLGLAPARRVTLGLMARGSYRCRMDSRITGAPRKFPTGSKAHQLSNKVSRALSKLDEKRMRAGATCTFFPHESDNAPD